MRYIIHLRDTGQIVRYGSTTSVDQAILQRGLSLDTRDVSLVPDEYTGEISDVTMTVSNGSLVKDETVLCSLTLAD